MAYQRIQVPADGDPIRLNDDFSLEVPDRPIIPLIEGDGIGIDVSPVMHKVVNAAVEKAYGGKRSIAWMEIYAGQKATDVYEGQWLPEETLDAMRRFVVSIKGPLATPVGGGIRSLNVSIRQSLDLYACVRPIRYFLGVSTPMKDSEQVDMVVFRENTEDIYAGIEWPAGSPENRKLMRFLEEEMGVRPFPHGAETGLGVKPVSRPGSQRLIAKALQYAIDEDRSSVTLVHKGNIMKFTEGAFCQWGYELAREQFGAEPVGDGPWLRFDNPRTGREIIVKDVIADNFLQQILLNPQDYDVVATLNLNGDYISDALAAQVGGIGIAPGANIGDGIGVFEATHGTAPGFAGKDRVNPGSLILSAEMMLRYMGWGEAADLVVHGMSRTIENKQLTYDLAVLREAIRKPDLEKARDRRSAEQNLEKLIPGAKLLGTRDFGDAIIAHMDD